MLKKLFTRGLVALLTAVLGYFVLISTDRSVVPIERSHSRDEPAAEEKTTGSDVRYKSYDASGNELVAGSSRKVTQTGERKLQLKDGLTLRFNQDGKRYDVRADSFKDADDGRQILSAEEGGQIYLAVDDVVIETGGPMIYDDVAGEFYTDARATFRVGEARGQAVGLRYKPDVFLELKRDTVFYSEGPEGDLEIDADFLRLDQTAQTASIRNGVLISSRDGQQTRLTAETINVAYDGDRKGAPFHLKRALLEGAPASFTWEDGGLDAAAFEVCFDETGAWIEELLTEEDAVFAAITSDGYAIHGQGGQLRLLAEGAKPKTLASQSAILIESRKAVGPVASLIGHGGFETQFRQGAAYSTRVFGRPEFQYDQQEGRAGSIRVMHEEGNILFSEGAELWDRAQNVRVRGDEIILDGWDLGEKEIFASKFVKIVYRQGEPDALQCAGDSLRLLLPKQFVRLTGSPARAWREGQAVEGEVVEIAHADEDRYDLRADRKVKLTMVVENGPMFIRAKSMTYAAAAETLEFDTVIQALIPGEGELSCDYLQAGLKRRGQKRFLEFVKASENVIYNGSILSEGKRQPISCQADRLDFFEGQRVIHFRGVGKDVVFKHPSGELTGRELTYFLNDGSIRVDSVTHGTTQTIINLKERL